MAPSVAVQYRCKCAFGTYRRMQNMWRARHSMMASGILCQIPCPVAFLLGFVFSVTPDAAEKQLRPFDMGIGAVSRQTDTLSPPHSLNRHYVKIGAIWL